VEGAISYSSSSCKEPNQTWMYDPQIAQYYPSSVSVSAYPTTMIGAYQMKVGDRVRFKEGYSNSSYDIASEYYYFGKSTMFSDRSMIKPVASSKVNTSCTEDCYGCYPDDDYPESALSSSLELVPLTPDEKAMDILDMYIDFIPTKYDWDSQESWDNLAALHAIAVDAAFD
jgi:hypothetical protein